jgi:hypothetical protein
VANASACSRASAGSPARCSRSATCVVDEGGGGALRQGQEPAAGGCTEGRGQLRARRHRVDASPRGAARSRAGLSPMMPWMRRRSSGLQVERDREGCWASAGATC